MPRMSTMIESTKLLLKDWEKAVNVAVKNPSLLNIQKAIKAEEIFSLKALAVSEKGWNRGRRNPVSSISYVNQ